MESNANIAAALLCDSRVRGSRGQRGQCRKPEVDPARDGREVAERYGRRRGVADAGVRASDLRTFEKRGDAGAGVATRKNWRVVAVVPERRAEWGISCSCRMHGSWSNEGRRKPLHRFAVERGDSSPPGEIPRVAGRH